MVCGPIKLFYISNVVCGPIKLFYISNVVCGPIKLFYISNVVCGPIKLFYISNAERTTLNSTTFAILSFFHQLTQYWLIAMAGKNITLEDGDVI